MLELLKKTVLAGIGASVVTMEAVEEQLNELVERGKITTGEARRTADKIMEQGKKEFSGVCDKMEDGFVTMLRKAKFATQEDLKSLESRISALEMMLAEQAAIEAEDKRASPAKKGTVSGA